MQKQAAFVLALSSKPDCLMLDEPIAGLDPLARQIVWKRVVESVADREMTVLVSSHNLREIEVICDSVGIVSKEKMLLERDLDELKSDIYKAQVAFPQHAQRETVYQSLSVLHKESRGGVDIMIIKEGR
jgi:ABC-2 type transport system ATP-binding protein